MIDADVSLPNKLSDLLEVALADLAKCERSPRYEVDMGAWHSWGDGDVCHVCLAGAVMAKTVGVARRAVYTPEVLKGECVKLYALDALRVGSVLQAKAHLLGRYLKTTGRLYQRLHAIEDRQNACYVSYDDDPRTWKRNMRQLVRDLREIGQ